LNQRVSQIMTRDPLTYFFDQNAVDAAMIMADHQVRCLPVIDGAQRLVGLLTADLIAENYSEHLAGETIGEIGESRAIRPVRPRNAFAGHYKDGCMISSAKVSTEMPAKSSNAAVSVTQIFK
jgi:CBS-domain-containing membrane protein